MVPYTSSAGPVVATRERSGLGNIRQLPSGRPNAVALLFDPVNTMIWPQPTSMDADDAYYARSPSTGMRTVYPWRAHIPEAQ
jgi:hypothetical protein